MRERLLAAWPLLAVLLAVPGLALSQDAPQNRTLIVNGQPGQAPVVQVNGRSYVDLEALAQITNGSLGYSGGQITLTLPGSAAKAATPTTAAPAANQPVPALSNPGFSKAFMTAGIEEMALVREWRSALGGAIQNGFPLNENWIAGYEGQANDALRLASVAASTSSDRSAYQLLANELANMQKLSDQIIAKRKAMEYMDPNTLNNDPLFQQILNCAHSLAGMASSGQFYDDGTCH